MPNTLVPYASGNWNDASAVWKLLSAVSNAFVESEAASTNISTTNTDSASFVLAATNVDAILIKLTSYITPTGTLTVKLRNSTTLTDVATITVNCSDLPSLSGPTWLMFPFSAHTPNGTDSYVVRVTRSVADSGSNRVTLYASSGTSISHGVRLVTTGSPAAGDQLIIVGELTGAGTSNTWTVTFNETANTSYGATSMVQSIAVCHKGTLTVGTAASTAYAGKNKGLFAVMAGGTFNAGTVGAPMPSTSSFVWTYDVATNVDSGMRVENGGSFVGQGVAKRSWTRLNASRGGICNTSGTAVTGLEGQSFTGLTGTININGTNYTISSVTDSTHLTLTGSAGTNNNVKWYHAGTGNVLTVLDTTGWLGSDQLIVTSTSTAVNDSELVTISTVDSSTQVTLTGNLVSPHNVISGVNPMIACVGNLTRNVRFQGTSDTLQGYINFQPTSSVDLDYVEFYRLGSGTTNKRGIDVATTTGSFSMQYCSLHDFSGISLAIAVNITGTSGNNQTVSHNFFYKVSNSSSALSVVATTATHTFDDNLGVTGTAANASIFIFSDAGSTITNNVAVGGQGGVPGFSAAEVGVALANFSNNECVANQGGGFSLDSTGGTISNLLSYRNPTFGLRGSFSGATLQNCTFFGNTAAPNIQFASFSMVHGIVTLDNCVLDGGVIFTSVVGFDIYGSIGSFGNVRVRVFSSTFGANSAHSTADIRVNTISTGYPNPCVVELSNCLLASVTEVSSQTSLQETGYISSQRHDQTAGNHKSWLRTGTITIDTTLFGTASPSVRMTPNNASSKLSLKYMPAGTLCVACKNGQAVTASVKVRESVSGDGTDYNGNRARLILLRNDAIGITADTVIATATSASEGAWETLSGTTAAPTDDGVMEFVVDCDGTTGWINVDDFAAVGGQPTNGMKYWLNGSPCVLDEPDRPQIRHRVGVPLAA